MGVPVFTNNASTVLASNITAIQTTLPLNSGTGSLFPSPTGGDYFMVTVVSATNPALYEVMQCTSRSVDTLTVVRAQEGTSAQAFSASDTVAILWTARGVLDGRQLRNLPTAAGTANALTVANSTPISAWIKGILQRWIPASANTAAATVAVDGNTAAALRAFGQPLIGSELQPGMAVEGIYDGSVVHLIGQLVTALGLASGALEAEIFTSGGNFTPLTSGKYLVIGIGGGGGGGGGAGIGPSTTANGLGGFGGSGGQLGFSIVTLTAGTAYPVVIGTGGNGGNSSGGTITAGSAGNPTTFNGVTIGAGGAGGLTNDAGYTAVAGTHSPAGGNGGGNGGGLGGAPVSGAGNGNSGTAGAANTGGGGGGGSGANANGTAKAGGLGGNGGSGILVVIRA